MKNDGTVGGSICSGKQVSVAAENPPNSDICIYDLNGLVLFRTEIHQVVNEINIPSSIASGLYICTIKSAESNTKTIKLSLISFN